MENNSHWMTTKQAAEYLGLSPKALHDRVHMRQIPFYRLGKSLRFKRTELDQMLERTRVKPIILGRY